MKAKAAEEFRRFLVFFLYLRLPAPGHAAGGRPIGDVVVDRPLARPGISRQEENCWRDKSVNALVTAILVFALTLGAGYAGLHMQTRLAESHKTGESRGVVGQIAGLIHPFARPGAGHADRSELRLFLDAKDRTRGVFRADPQTRPGAEAIRAGDAAGAGEAQGGNHQRL